MPRSDPVNLLGFAAAAVCLILALVTGGGIGLCIFIAVFFAFALSLRH